MNKDIARKLIAIVASEKKNLSQYSKQDFVTTLSFKRSLMDPESVEKFVDKSAESGLLMSKEGSLSPNFSTSGIVVPLDFSVDMDELFSDSVEKPLVDRLLDAASASGKMTKKEAMARAKEILKNMNYLNFEIALLSVIIDEGIEADHFIRELKG